jgi:hypothetical protein
VVIDVTIANNESLSSAAWIWRNNHLGTVAAIVMPADWTAADLTFQASVDNSTYWNVYDADDAEVTVQAAEDRHIILDPADFAGCPYLKVRSGTSGAAVNQGAARTIQLVLREVS